MGTPFGPEYIPYTYMDPLGKGPSTQMTTQIPAGSKLGAGCASWKS